MFACYCITANSNALVLTRSILIALDACRAALVAILC
jgi:hypothetical protein